MWSSVEPPPTPFAGPRGAISVVRAFCMATGRVPVHIFDVHLIARECNVNRSMYMSTRGRGGHSGFPANG